MSGKQAGLVFHYGTMASGKSTLALQVHYNMSNSGRRGRVYTQLDRGGAGVLSSRIGLAAEAESFGRQTNFCDHDYTGLQYLIVDEAQFLTAEQVDQLGWLADGGTVQVMCFGLLTNYGAELFEGSKRLVEVADTLQPLPVPALCLCGEPGVVNGLIVDGILQAAYDPDTGPLVGDTEAGHQAHRYQVLCRKHWSEFRGKNLGKDYRRSQ